MAKSLNYQEIHTLPTDPSTLAKYGISLIINNRVAEAEKLFRTNSESIQMAAGYAFAAFLDAATSFEEEKLQIACNILRETEKKVATDMGWVTSVKYKIMGTKTTSLAEKIEMQIILADIQVFVSILTFLQYEYRGFIKSGWVLRKAWKIYQRTYLEIVEIYKQKFGEFNLPEPTDFEWTDYLPGSPSPMNSVNSEIQLEENWAIPASDSSPTKHIGRNGYVPISTPVHKPNIPHSQSNYLFSKTSFFPFSIRRSGSAHSSLTKNTVNSENSTSTFSLLSPLTTSLSFITSTFNLLTSSNNNTSDIEPETVTRLMSAVCFGYGLLTLGISLLPPTMLKVTNFLGFNADRSTAISSLMYARKGTDMRAPLATLALLWYHTIVRPYYALDGTNVKAGLESASLLIRETQQEYGQSALFLFFKGRIHRLNSNIPLALESYQAAVNNSPQREIRLLALHEVGWCYLIQLDYIQAQKVFMKLKKSSRWSKTFYAYVAIICSGASGRREFREIEELRDVYLNSNKDNNIDLFIKKKLNMFPNTEDSFNATEDIYWMLFVHELLYLWNALPSCSLSVLDNIIADCNSDREEPMPGLAKLIQGECFTIIGNYDKAVEILRRCIEIRSNIIPKDDTHISAYGECSLGILLTKKAETKEEGISMLEHASHYKDYDFENKLQFRINMALKNVS